MDMRRAVFVFMAFLVPPLGFLLATLGWWTLAENWMGLVLIVVGLSYAIGVIVVIWIKRAKRWNRRNGGEIAREEKGDRSFWLIIPGMIAIFTLPALEYRLSAGILPRGWPWQFGGLLLVVVGIGLFLWAARTLGAGYSQHVSVTHAQPLVQNGPYRLVRHPAYFGFLLMGLGLAIGYSSLAGFIILPTLLIPGLVYRIKTEECLLEEHFQEEHRQYAARTKFRLFPGIW